MGDSLTNLDFNALIVCEAACKNSVLGSGLMRPSCVIAESPAVKGSKPQMLIHRDLGKGEMMVTRKICNGVVFLIMFFAACASLLAQQPQIPTLQVCNQTRAVGKATLRIDRRRDARNS